MDIDFIKWMCEKAEHYQVSDSDFILSISDKIELCELSELKIDYPVNYRDILQEAIEGVNREYERETKKKAYSIDILSDCVEVGLDCYSMKNYFIDEHESIDAAKESALRYVYDQERAGA